MIGIILNIIFYIQRQLTAAYDQYKCEALLLGAIGELSTLETKADSNLQNVIVDHKSLPDGHESSFVYIYITLNQIYKR